MRRISLIAGLCAAGVLQAHAQDEAPFDVVVDRYVAEGLRSNLALQSESLEVEKATQALAAARARFLPEVSLQARYTRADGGREFTMPIGAALNPVYSKLNDLLAAQGQPPRSFRRSRTSPCNSCAKKSRTHASLLVSRSMHRRFRPPCVRNARCSTPAASIEWRSRAPCAATSRSPTSTG